MYQDEIEKIQSRLPKEFEGTLSPETASEYKTLWDTGVRLLADRSDDKRAFFRDTLLLTIKLNRRFSVGASAGNRVRRIILDAFMERSNAASSQLEDNTEPTSGMSQLQELETHSAKHIVFETVLTQVAWQFDIKFNVKGALKHELAAAVPSLPIPSRSKMVLERWATTEAFLGSFDRISEEDMRLVLDQIYTFLCVEWGPSDADSMMSDVITQVELIPESRQFSPRKIL